MSHFATVKEAKVTDVDAFIKACAEYGMTEVKRSGATIKAWARGDREDKVDVFCGYPESGSLCGRPKAQFGSGLKKNGDHYDMVADWSLTGFGLPSEIKAKLPHVKQFPGTDVNGEARQACDEFRGPAMRDTSRHAIVSKFSKQGFMVDVKEEQDQTLRIRMTR